MNIKWIPKQINERPFPFVVQKVACQSKTDPNNWKNDPSLTKLQKQHQAILDVIKLKGFDPMQIPDCEKGTIRTICETDYPTLFDGTTSFDNAWKDGRALFRMANHASFSRRGKV